MSAAANQHIIPARLFNTQVNAGLRNVGLDVVRGICVLLVVVSHSNNIWREHIPLVYKFIYPVGEMAQDLFFALSGYLIGGQILNMSAKANFGKKELFHFYKKRWLRTIPFYFFFILLNLALFYGIYLPIGPAFLHFGFKVWPYFVFAQNLAWPHPPFFPEIWPIPVEEWLYVLLPLPFLFFSAFFKSGNSFQKKLAYLLLLIVAVQVLRTWHILSHHPETDWQLRKIVIYRLDALAYGFLLALLTQAGHIKNYIVMHRNRLLWLGLLLLAASLGFRKIMSNDVYNLLLFWYQPAATALLLPFFIYRDFLPGKFAAFFAHLSLTGYAILLSHLYCLQFLCLTFFNVSTVPGAAMASLLYWPALLIFSTLFYNYVERPILLLRKK